MLLRLIRLDERRQDIQAVEIVTALSAECDFIGRGLRVVQRQTLPAAPAVRSSVGLSFLMAMRSPSANLNIGGGSFSWPVRGGWGKEGGGSRPYEVTV